MADVSGLKAHLLEWAGLVHSAAVAGTEVAVRLAAPVGEVDGGATRDGIVTTGGSAGPVFTANIQSTTEQGDYVEFGTSPHSIDPVNATVLVFPGDGGMVFARHVDHPGNVAMPWFHPTLEAEWPAQLELAAGLFG